MAGKAIDLCSYKDCRNRRGDAGIILFCFPSKKNTERWLKWCENAGIDPANVKWRTLICNAHFRAEDFTTFQREKLVRHAVPIDYKKEDTAIQHPFDPSGVVRVYDKNDEAIKSIQNIQLRESSSLRSLSRQSHRLGGGEKDNDTFEWYIPSPPRAQTPEVDDSSG